MTKQLLQFIQNHWMLCTAFAVALALIIFEEVKNKVIGLPKIAAADAILLLDRENALMIDLRSQAAFLSGHILGATNVARTDIEQNLEKLKTHKDRPLILVDDNDTNTSTVGAKFKQIGFTKIYALAGGLTAWKEAHLPLNKN